MPPACESWGGPDSASGRAAATPARCSSWRERSGCAKCSSRSTRRSSSSGTRGRSARWRTSWARRGPPPAPSRTSSARSGPPPGPPPRTGRGPRRPLRATPSGTPSATHCSRSTRVASSSCPPSSTRRPSRWPAVWRASTGLRLRRRERRRPGRPSPRPRPPAAATPPQARRGPSPEPRSNPRADAVLVSREALRPDEAEHAYEVLDGGVPVPRRLAEQDAPYAQLRPACPSLTRRGHDRSEREHALGPAHRHGLGDHPSHGDAGHMGRLDAEVVEQPEGVVGHVVEQVRRLDLEARQGAREVRHRRVYPCGAAGVAVVEADDVKAPLREQLAQLAIPVDELRAQPHHEQQRRVRGVADRLVHDLDPVGSAPLPPHRANDTSPAPARSAPRPPAATTPPAPPAGRAWCNAPMRRRLAGTLVTVAVAALAAPAAQASAAERPTDRWPLVLERPRNP